MALAGAALSLLAGLLGLLALLSPVAAQSVTTTLVSNANQGDDSNWTVTNDRSQAFTTGATGATLSSVGIISQDGQGNTFAVSLCTVDASDHPTSSCTDLTPPSSFAAGTVVFTPPDGTTLNANTTYALLVTSTVAVRLDATTSDNEDAGGATGWSIANTFDQKNTSDVWVANATRSLRITIKGTLDPATNTAPTVATEIPDQTAMSGTAFSYEVPAATFADADSDTLTYMATLADGTELPSWLSFSAATRTFSGTPTAAETVSVKVTASDASDSVSDTFDIVVSGQTDTTFISNSAQVTSTSSFLIRATAFTTGSNSGGYGLSSVDVYVGTRTAFNPLVEIYEDNAGAPGTLHATLSDPATVTGNSANTFTATNTTLSATTTYWLVTRNSDSTNGQGFRVNTVTNTTADTGAATGWSIGNGGYKSDNADPTWTSSNRRIIFTIKGTITASSNNAPTVATAISDQTATTGTALSFAFPADTFADADSDTLTYSATLADDTALPLWLSFSAATRTFSGTPQAADVETVSVKVTASDGNGGSVSDTFDIVVDLPPDTSSTLVSNANQGEDHNWTTRQDWSQTFTTSVGATLSSVEIISEDAEGDDAAVSLCTVDGSDHPTSTCTVLTAPPSFAAGTLVFRAPANTPLAANTTYSLLIASPGGEWLLLDATDSDNEDAGGATGWSIANTFDVEDSPDTWVARALALRITIKGTINNSAPTVATEIPDQTAMSGTAFSYQVPAATFTDADSDTLTYEATLADDMALPSWLSFAPATRTFSGTPTAVETVSVKVTASDGTESVSDTFDIVVDLPPDTSPTLVSNAGQGEDSSWNNSRDRSQAFTTSAGATLSSVEIISEDTEGDDVAVSLCTVDANDRPTSSCTDLTAPLSFPAGTLVFTAPDGTTLAANTTYSLLITSPGGDALKLDATTSDDEDAGGATGWSIANTFDNKNAVDAWAANLTRASRITIKGTIDPATNNAPMGEPTISGTARVGRTLTASTTGITDADGLTSPTYTYQWIRANGTDADIASANSSTYTLVDADLGKTIKVKVSFTDDASNTETLTSAAYPSSGTVQANNVLVSNVGQTQSSIFSLATFDLAQSFRTGANATGYTLTSIELRLDSTNSTNTPVVKLYSGSANGTLKATFTGPAMLDASSVKNYAFTPSSAVILPRSTTYWVVVEGATDWTYTLSTGEDGTSAVGWSIGDNSEYRNEDSTGNFLPDTGNPFLIHVTGTLGGIATTGICSRALAVQTPILAATSRTACADVTTADLASVTTLSVMAYGPTSIDPADFAGLTGLTSLWISASPQLTTVPDNAFAGLTALTTLNFNVLSSLTTLGEDAFAGLTTLENLNLSVNLLTTLHADIFDGLTALGRLELQDNLLTTLDEDIFDGLTALNSLELNNNRSLAALDADIFDGLTALEYLDLSSTNQTALDADIFDDLTALKTLYLSGNSLTTLDADIFDGLTALETLVLNINSLTTLDADIFDGLTALDTLALNNNSLTTLDADIFDGLTALIKLYLNSNLLTTLDADLFDGLTALYDLRLDQNSLSTLDADIFDGLTALGYLELQDNRLTALDADIFDGITLLERLDLKCNYFTALDLNIFNPFVATLTYLDLMSDSFTTPPVESAIRAKFHMITDVLIGVTPCLRVTVSPTSLTVAEGATGTYTVALRAQPTGDVAVAISSDNPDVTVTPTTALIFTAANWDTAQTVTVSAAQDTDEAHEAATLILDPDGNDYDFVISTVLTVTVTDDDADTTAPQVASIVRQVPTSSPTNADSLTWRVTFSEAVLNVDAADFAVSGTTATVTAVAAVSGLTGGYDVTASGGNLAGVSATVGLAIAASHNIQDGASNALSNTTPTGTNDNSYVVDNTAPTVTISGVPSASNAPFTATFTFSEAVTGFAVGDITLTNASVSNFTATSTTVFTALVTPTASGMVTVNVAANAAQDAVGNGNTAASLATTIYTPPAITITAGTSPVTEGTSAVFTLSRAGSTTAALTVNVTVSETGGDMVAASNEGDRTVAFLANAATATLSVTTASDNVDEANSVVTATISADTGSPVSYSVGTPASAMVTVEDNDTRGVKVSATALPVNEGSTGTYTVVLNSQPTASVTVTPSRTGSSDVTFSPPTLTFTASTWDTVQQVTVTAAQDSDAVDDSATISHAVTGGDYVGVTVESVVVTVDDDETADTTAPRVASIARQNPTSSPTNADSLTWRVTFSEAVSNVNAADFAVSGTTATVTAVATVSGVTGAYDVTASGGNLASVSATVTLTISSSHNIADGASNALSNTAPTGTNDNSYVVDNTAPSVTISGVPSASDAPFTATFTFSEAVTGFTAGDITLTNASASSFTVTSTVVFTALITPAVSGTVTVDVPANAARDAAGNGNTAAARATSTYTGTAALPAITIAAGASPVTEGTSAVFTLSRTGSTTDALTVNVTVSEAGGDMVAASNEGARTVTFLANAATATLSIATASDSVAEANSVVTATVAADTGSPASYSVGAPGSAMVTVRDDDSNITVPGAPTALSATAAGGTQINLSWTAPTDDGGSPIIGYKIEVSPDGNADWTELVANTGNANTTYEHIGLTVGTSRHYRVSAINSDGVGDPSNIDDAIASVPTVTLRTQSVPESIGTAMLVVTLDQPASAPLSVPWYTLSSTAASPGDYTNGAGTLIIPSGVTNATISITITDDAVEEPTETVLVLLSPGDGYELGGSGATLSILDDDGDGPAPSGATVDGATVVLTYNKPLDGASTPSSTAFVLRVAGDPVSINEVSVDGSEVTLTLAAPVPAGQTVSLDYTQPMSNPIQDGSGKKAQSFTRWYLVTESTSTITNPVITVPGAPTALSATAVGNTQINLSWTAPGENGGAPISGYKIEVSPDGNADWTVLVANTGTTTYAHIGLAVGTTRHYRVSAINSVGAGAPSNIDDAIASIPSLSLRTQSIPEGIGTAAVLVTLNQPAGDPLSVPWYTLNGDAVSPGDYTAGAGQLIIPSGATSATISITIIDDADAEATETVLVLLSPGEGYALGGSGATLSILDDDGDGPAPSGATVNGTTVVLTYNKSLDGASTPSSTAFVLRVAGDPVSINEVSVDGSEVTLTLASPVQAGQTVSLDYTQPMSNPIQDGSGNKAQSFTRWYLVTGSTITGTVDNTAPRVASIVRETPTSSPTNADSLTWRVTFSEAVSNVDAADFVVSGTTATVTAVAAVSGVTGGYDVTASGGNLAGVSATVGLAIASSHNIQDGASNALSNTAPTGTNDNSYVVDNTAPTVTISDVPATSDAPFTATFTFPEAVTGFAVGDITLGNATASSFTVTSTTVYRALVTPTAAGAVTVDVPANAAQDAAGNGNTAATRASSTYTGSATRGVTVSATVLTVNEGTTGTYTVVLNSQPTASVTVTPSRTGSSDVTFSPPTLTFTASTWDTVQQVTVTAAQDSDAVDDSATISHAVTGGDYVGVTVESVVVTVDDDETADSTAPRVASIVRETPTSSPTNADSLTWRVTFSEAVSNVDAADFVVSGTTATVTAVAAVSGVTGAYDVTASGGNLAGVSATVTLTISSSHNIADGASNALSNTAPTGTNDNSYVLDNTAPSVTISGVPSASDAPFTATFTFSEAVTGFAAGDITLTNASASSFTSTSTMVFTALITPAVSGTVTVDVPANAAQDAAGNGNTAAARATSTYTGTAALPAITIAAGASPVTEGTSAVFTLSRTGSTTDALTVNVTVSEAGGDMVAASNEGARTVTFLANSTTVTLSIATASDSVAEANSVVTATISADTGSPASYSVGAPDSAMVTVRDDDSNITVPGAPTDLSASTGGDTRINLSWTAPGDDGGSPISGYKIEVSPDGNANWTELVANTGNTTTTYAHIGLAVGTTRHYRVSAINSAGAGDPSNIDDATVIITTVTLRTQSIPEGIGTAAVLVTLNQPAGDPLSVPWYTLNGDAVSPGDYTAGAGQLIIPSGATSATISITIIDDADAEATETVLVLLSPGEGYVLGGSGATLSILDDDGDGPAPIRATVNGTTVVLTYNKSLDGASTPSSTAFVLRVAGDPVSINEVSVDGSEVTLTLAAPVQAGQTVSLDYTQPMSNPIQDASGNNKAQSFTRWYLVTDSTITKPAITVPGVPTDLSASTGGETRINLSWTAPGDDGGSPIIGYKIEVSPDGNTNWTDLVANTGNTATTYAHIGLAAGTTRHYRVSAINAAGAGGPSNIDDATTGAITGPITTGGGGGGGGPTPSEVDFEWNVKRDIEELDGGNDWPTGLWSDGETLWIAENGQGADDEVYAYDLASGERVESREFALADTNRAPRGIWSDGETAWVSDSGRERLFAYRLADGERVEEREFELPRENRDARGIWSDEKTMWVLDGRADALFAYDFESGELLAEYALDAANDDPHGIWSDGVTIWVSDHGAKRLIAYRLPVLPDAETDSGAQGADDDARELERVRDEEFSKLSRASNNSPRGIWSDGDVMYVADESDDRVYSYNMPDAADARLASLTLSGVDIGEFSSSNTEYEAVVADGVTATTVEAEAMQRRTDVAIDPPDADVEADGHQVALQDLGEITVTVSSADGSRTKTYRVRLGEEEAAGSVAGCLRGDIAVGFSLVVYAGGSIEDLVACAEGRNVAALYVLDGGEWVSYIVGAPEFVNRSFAGLFAEGLAALTPLIARSDGPASPDPSGDEPRTGDATQPWPACLQGEIAEGFNLVVYEEGSVGELEACAEGVGLAALYALSDGVWVFYIVGAPEFVNRSFAALFADGVPSATPLVGKRN